MYQIINGDCLVEMRKMKDNSVDAIAADPPYDILKHAIETKIDIPAFMAEADRVLKPDGVLLYFGKMPKIVNWYLEAVKYRPFKEEIIWDKKNGTSPNHRVLKQHENVYIHSTRPLNEVFLDAEFCYINQYLSFGESFLRIVSELKGFLNNPFKLRQYADYLENPKACPKELSIKHEQSSISENFLSNKSTLGKIDIFRRGYKARSVVTFPSGNFAKGGERFHHPTVKSVPMMEYLLRLCSKEGDLVLDPFTGTGTTLVAAESLGRNSIGIELSAEYCEIARARLAHAAGENHIGEVSEMGCNEPSKKSSNNPPDALTLF